MEIIKKSFILTLILILLLQSSIVFAITYDGGNTLVKESEWTQYKSDEFLDSSLSYYITVNSGKYYFNKELWEELSFVVYGDYSSIYPNDFKPSTLNPTGEAYYTTGEYRYHGYSRSGSKVNNAYFPDDVVGDNDNLEARTWMYEPWVDTSPAYDNFGKYVGKLGIYNSIALEMSEDSSLVAKWINKSTDFIDRGTVTGTDVATNLDSVHYNNIDSAPSAYSSGQGTLFHQSNYTNKIYYQTFPVTKYNKEYTEIEADIPQISVVNIADNGDITLNVQVTGEIFDDSYIGDSIKESIYYTRKDIKEWNFTLTNSITSDVLTVRGTNRNANKEGYYDFSLTIPKSRYESFLGSDDSFNVIFTAKATAIYSTNETAQDIVTKTKKVTGVIEEFIETSDIPEPIEFVVNASRKILDVDLFPLSLTEINTNSAVDRYVLVNGVRLSEAEENRFLHGQYKFPEIMEDRVYSYSIVYIDTEGELSYFSSSVVVYDSVPHAKVLVDGAFKENRKITVTADKSIVSDYLNSRSNVVISEFTIISADGEEIYFGTNNNEYKEFLRKSEGNINVHVTVANEYGSRTYDHEVYVSPDYEPDIISIVWNNVLIRNEALDILSEGASLDGDTVTDMTYQIFYDTDNDEDPETEIYSGTWEGSTTYTPDKLGNYKIVFKATENFGEETIPEYINEDEKRFKVVEREFFVDNLIPMTKVYTDIEYSFPQLDVAFLIDEGLPQDETDTLRSSYVDITNNFRANSMTANVDVWDLKTYVYEQTAYTNLHTGTSYPPSTTEYDVSGYTGTLIRTSVNNYPYTVDYGSYQTFSDSKTAYGSAYGYGTTVYYKGVIISQTSTSTPSIYYSSGGYSGTLYKTGASLVGQTITTNGDYRYVNSTYLGSYSGTVTRYWTAWVPNYVTYNNFYGNYSGTVYKNVKQEYIPTYQTESNKYIIYIADDSLNNIDDYNYVKDIAKDSKVIFIGSSSLESQFISDYFVAYSSNTTNLINEIVGIIKGENPVYQGLTVLLGEGFNVSHSDIDYEGDPIITDGFQYVHNPYFFDNSLGQESDTLTSYLETGYTSLVKSSFSKPGLYTIYRRVKDEPIGYEALGDYSNIAELEVVAHRKPIADVYMDWDFDGDSGTYNIEWIDLSYDPDFQYSRVDKGIVNRSIKYKSSTGDWVYGIPDSLEPDSYTLEYAVMDCYNVWSDIKTIEFTLDNIPDIQLIDAKLTTENPEYSITSVPKGANLRLYDVLTRYPYEHYLNVAIYQEGTRLSEILTISFDGDNIEVQIDNDVYWSDIIVPMDLPKGDYYVKIEAVGDHGDTAYLDLPFSVIDIDVTGYVNHTEQWDLNRIKYNQAITGTNDQPRTYAIFFPGEKFVLNADTLGNPDSVFVEILDTEFSTYLVNEGDDVWIGSLWHEDMMNWTTQDLVFRFTAFQDSKPVKYYDVSVKVIDDEYWRQHRLF